MAKVSGRSITFGWIGSVSLTSTMTTSGAAENGLDTLRQPPANVHRMANTVEEEPGTAEFHTATMLPTRSRLICTGTSTRSPAAGPPSARTRIVNGVVSTVAGLR